MIVVIMAAALAGGCPEGAAAWVDACAADAGLTASIEACPPGHVIVRVASPGGEALTVDIAAEGFRRAGAVALSPVGEFADWSAVDAGRRAAFDALVHCADGAAFSLDDVEPARWEPSAPPWRAAAALLLLLGVVALRARTDGARAVALQVAPLAGLTAATFAFQWLAVDTAFFHQNGQGPLWLMYAAGEPSPYGPGFGEMFGVVLAWSPGDPETALFFAQSLVCAAGPACAWTIARGVGATRWLAWAVAAAVAIDPLWARLAHSESYFATGTALLLLAGAALAAVAPRPARRAAWLAGVAAAALLIAQAARIHPVVWVPSSLLPLIVLLAGDGTRRDRARRAAIATAVIAAIVAVTAGPALLDVLHGDTAGKWTAEVDLVRLAGNLIPLLPIAAALAWLARRDRDALIAVAAMCGAVAVAVTTFVLESEVHWVRQSYWRLAAVPVLAPAVAVVAQLARSERARHIAAAAVGAAAIAAAVSQWSSLTELPTDAREATVARQWRERIPHGARVYFVARAGDRVLYLPWHRRDRRLAVDGDGADLRDAAPGTWYYRSSLCSTPEGAPLCASIESRHRLDPVVEAQLPAIPSKHEMPYDTDPVRVGLYRITK